MTLRLTSVRAFWPFSLFSVGFSALRRLGVPRLAAAWCLVLLSAPALADPPPFEVVGAFNGVNYLYRFYVEQETVKPGREFTVVLETAYDSTPGVTEYFSYQNPLSDAFADAVFSGLSYEIDHARTEALCQNPERAFLDITQTLTAFRVNMMFGECTVRWYATLSPSATPGVYNGAAYNNKMDLFRMQVPEFRGFATAIYAADQGAFVWRDIEPDAITVVADVPPTASISAITGSGAGQYSASITLSDFSSDFTVDDLTVTNATASLTGSGRDYVVALTPLASGPGTVSIAAGRFSDPSGDFNVAASNEVSAVFDADRPTISIAPFTGAVAGQQTAVITLSEDSADFTVDDLTLTNATAELTGSGSNYTAVLTPLADGEVALSVAAGTFTDAAGNSNTASNRVTTVFDPSAPEVALTTTATGLVNDVFEVSVTFSEAVTGFDVSDLTVGNGTASNFAGSGAVYTADITPSADGAVTIEVAAGVAQDAAGNANTAAAPLSVQADVTAPGLTITSDQSTVSGPFEATFTFSEDVTGFALEDIAVDNGVATALSGSGAVYTALITPRTIGQLTLGVAAASAADRAGNGNTAANLSVGVVVESSTLALTLSSDIVNPRDVTASATLKNPGGAPLAFTASADVSWVDVTPTSGTFPALGDLDLMVGLNEGVNALEPGEYQVTIAMEFEAGGALAGVQSLSTGSPGTRSHYRVEIPLTVSVAARFGSIELVATTPSHASGEASFTYASDLPAFAGVTLTTVGGRASLAAGDSVLLGAYAISQSTTAGWRLESITCAGDLDGGSTFNPNAGEAVIDLDPGESLVCTFENVRDEDAVRVATQRAIYNFMARRADRIVAAAPDLSTRFTDRDAARRGAFAADMDGSGRSNMAFSLSLAGMRNAAAADTPIIPGAANPERPFAEQWDVWLATEWSRIEDDRGGDGASSDIAIAQLGIDRQVSDGLILGVMAQYDWMDEMAEDVNASAGAVAGARVEGEGWMVGPYAVWRVRDQLILDGLVMYGQSDNTVNPLGLYADGFETDRLMARVNLTGEFQSGAWSLRPQINLTHFEETQGAYVDSLNIAIPEQTVRLGRITAGPEVVWRKADETGSLELSTSLRAVWDYDAAGQINDAGLLVAAADDLRADARFGIGMTLRSGIHLSTEAGFAGLGVNRFEATTLRFELRIPFGAPGRAGGRTQAAPFRAGADARCQGAAGSGYANAANRTQTCDTWGHARTAY